MREDPEIEGPLQALRASTVMPGLEMQRRVDDLGGGRWRAYAVITDPGVIETLEGRGLTVRVVMDEEEMDRRIKLDLEMMQDAGDDMTPTNRAAGPVSRHHAVSRLRTRSSRPAHCLLTHLGATVEG